MTTNQRVTWTVVFLGVWVLFMVPLVLAGVGGWAMVVLAAALLVGVPLLIWLPGRGREQAPSMGPSSAEPDAADQIRELADLRDAGILTDEEFNAKKADLLNRM